MTLLTGRVPEVFRVFLALGLRCFGGPIAHLGYFHHEFVARRGWLDADRFGQLVGISQFLPGPASSQLGFAIGLMRAGLPGGVAAFAGFTLPSALLMFAFARIAADLDRGAGAAVVQGLKLVAVCIVAHGLVGMARRLTPDRRRIVIAAASCLLMLTWRVPGAQLIAIAAGAALGAALLNRHDARASAALPAGARPGRSAGWFLGYAVLLLVALVVAAREPSLTALGAAFYRAGALVFGGGHVVLPLLQQTVVAPGWISADTFLSGYGAAQAVPGPMFSVAAFLGAKVNIGAPPWVGAMVAIAGIFLPGFLLLLAVLPVWTRVTAMAGAGRIVAGVNAAVVGLLAAALYDPIWTHGVTGPADIAIIAIGFLLLAVARVGALWVVLWCVVASMAVTLTT